LIIFMQMHEDIPYLLHVDGDSLSHSMFRVLRAFEFVVRALQFLSVFCIQCSKFVCRKIFFGQELCCKEANGKKRCILRVVVMSIVCIL
jgi:hypothetical protein